MKILITVLLIIVSISPQAQETFEKKELFEPKEVIMPLNILKPEVIDLLENNQAPVWCATYCRALKDQCLLTYSNNYCTQEFGDCVDECLDPDSPPGGPRGGGNGNNGGPA